MKFRKAANPNAEMPFLDHLEELRWRILWSVIALTIASIGSFFVVTSFDVIGLLKQPAEQYLMNNDGKLVFLAITDPFFITLRLAISMGFVLASPIIFYQVWSFLSPALLPRERRAIVPSLYMGLVLFIGGAALAYFFALPFTVKFMTGFQSDSLVQMITANDYFAFVLKLMLGFGIMFEMPVIIMILAAMGLASSRFLREKRRYAYAGIAVAAAMITPGDVVVPTLILLGPLAVLYETSIGLARLVERKRQSEVEESSTDALPEGV
jgi:sec-independent protein translocase protein TatC